MTNDTRFGADPTLSHRVAGATVTLTREDGTPHADADDVVEQVDHRFGFGNIGFDFIGLANDETDDAGANVFGGATASQAAQLADLWFDLFNTATLPFYWGGFEPERGRDRKRDV